MPAAAAARPSTFEDPQEPAGRPGRPAVLAFDPSFPRNLVSELDREDDGRWPVEVPELPGVVVDGSTRTATLAWVKALALKVIADRLDHGDAVPDLKRFGLVPT